MSLDQPSQFVKPETLTQDAFLGGRLTVTQPRRGFRAGLDSVLLGASIDPQSLAVLDLGCGVGTAAMVALQHNPQARATLADQDPAMLALAAHNLDINGLADRADLVALDVAARGAVRLAAGLAANQFTSVIANPPFFTQGTGTPATDRTRAAARQMPAGQLDLWVRTAAASATAGAEIVFVYAAPALGQLLAAFERRFGAVTLLPLSPRPGAAMSRVLIRGSKGSKAPLTLLAGRALHLADGRQFAPEFDAIFRGTARLDW